MNAHEAIEHEQKELDELKDRLETIKRREKYSIDIHYYRSQKYMLESLIKQKSIVLESAKLFHEYSVPELFSYLQKNLGYEEVKTVETIYREPIDNLGIDVNEFIDEEGAVE